MPNFDVKSFVLTVALLSSSSGFASTLVSAEGNVYTDRPSAEYIVLEIAKRRLVNDARNKCRGLGFTNEPTLIDSPFCTASYANRAWSAQCNADFDCE